MGRRVRCVVVAEVDVDRLLRRSDKSGERFVRRFTAAEIAERRGMVEVADADRSRLSESRGSMPSHVGCSRSNASRSDGSSEPSSSSSIPSSRFDFSEIRTGPSRSARCRTRLSNSATVRGRSPGSFGANSNPSGTCSAQRRNCSSAGSRYPVVFSSTVENCSA